MNQRFQNISATPVIVAVIFILAIGVIGGVGFAFQGNIQF